MLADADCDSIQGYYLAKPMEPSDLESWLLQGATLQFRTFGDDPAMPASVTPTVAATLQGAGGHVRRLGPRSRQRAGH
jgi:hypothetical protein